MNSKFHSMESLHNSEDFPNFKYKLNSWKLNWESISKIYYCDNSHTRNILFTHMNLTVNEWTGIKISVVTRDQVG